MNTSKYSLTDFLKNFISNNKHLEIVQVIPAEYELKDSSGPENPEINSHSTTITKIGKIFTPTIHTNVISKAIILTKKK